MNKLNTIISEENEKNLMKTLNKMYAIIDKEYGDEKEEYFDYIEKLHKKKKEIWLNKMRIKREVEEYLNKNINNDQKAHDDYSDYNSVTSVLRIENNYNKQKVDTYEEDSDFYKHTSKSISNKPLSLEGAL